MREIVVLGAGYAGLTAAVSLSGRLRGRTDVRITVVGGSERFTERLRLHQVASGQELANLHIPALLGPAGVRFEIGWVTAVDVESRVVRLDDERDLPYDTLVYALGAVADTGAVPGAADHAYTLDSAREVALLSRRLPGTLAICGTGLAGVEAAAEIAERNPATTVWLLGREEPGAGIFNRPARGHLRGALDRLGVRVRSGVEITKVLPDGVELAGWKLDTGGRVDGGRVDGGRVDGGRVDGGRVDGGQKVGGQKGGGQKGGGRVDGGPVDGGRVDGGRDGGGQRGRGRVDSGPVDGRRVDGGRVDGGRVDGGRDGGGQKGGEFLAAGATLWAGGVRVAPLAAAAGLAVDDRGRIVTDAALRSVSHPEVFAVGDAAAIRQAYGMMHGTCQSGMPTGVHAARSIVRELDGRPSIAFRYGYFHTPISLGRRDGVVQFTRADHTPGRLYLTGRRAAWYKETVSASPWPGFGRTYRMPAIGLLAWRRGGRHTR